MCAPSSGEQPPLRLGFFSPEELSRRLAEEYSLPEREEEELTPEQAESPLEEPEREFLFHGSDPSLLERCLCSLDRIDPADGKVTERVLVMQRPLYRELVWGGNGEIRRMAYRPQALTDFLCTWLGGKV